VAGAVRKAGDLVSRPEPGIHDHLAGGGVHRLAGGSRLGGRKGRVLRLSFQIPDLLLAIARLTKDGRTGNVRLVAFDGAAIVDEDNVPDAQRLRLNAAVRESGVFAELGHGSAAISQGAIAGVNVGAQFRVGHTFAQRTQSRFVASDGDVAG